MDEQQPQTIQATPYASPMHTLAGSIVFLTNPESDIRKLELTLRGMVESNGQFIRISEPLMNEDGIQSVIRQVMSVSNRNTHMSKFDDEQVYKIIMGFSETLRIDLMTNRVKYEMKNPHSSRGVIATVAKLVAYESLQRGHEQGERNFWKGSQQEITTRVANDGGKKGILQRALGWGSK